MLVALAFVSLLVLALLDNVRGPFYPDVIKEFGLSNTLGSLFFAFSSMVSFLSCLSAHRFLHRYNSVVLLTWSSLFLGLGFLGMSLSPHYSLVLVSCLVFGAGYGGLNLAQAVLIGSAATGERRRKLFSGLHSMYALASLVAPLLATLSREFGLSWRLAFLGFSMLPFLMALWSWRHSGHVSLLKPAVTSRPTPLNAGEWRLTLAFSIIMSIYLWGEISLSTRSVLWLRTRREVSANAADLYLSGFFLLLLLGRIYGGYMGFGRMSNRLVLSLSAILGALLYLIGLNFWPLALVFSGLAMAPFYPILMDEISNAFQHKSQQALGFVIGAGSLSVVGMHLFIGFVSDLGGLTTALELCAGLLLVIPVFLTAQRRLSILKA